MQCWRSATSLTEMGVCVVGQGGLQLGAVGVDRQYPCATVQGYRWFLAIERVLRCGRLWSECLAWFEVCDGSCVADHVMMLDPCSTTSQLVLAAGAAHQTAVPQPVCTVSCTILAQLFWPKCRGISVVVLAGTR